LFHSIGTFAGSITEAVWPLGCSIRRNVSLVLSSTSWLVATETERRLACRNFTPSMGKVTSAFRKVQMKRRPLSCSWSRSSPQQRIGAGADQARVLGLRVVGLVWDEAERCPHIH
jgi:hypothetical protein